MLTQPVIIFSIENCMWNIEIGWYKGTDIDDFATDNKDECSAACCAHPDCGTWTWRNKDNLCLLKKGDDLSLMNIGGNGKGHWTAIKTGSKVPVSLLISYIF